MLSELGAPIALDPNALSPLGPDADEPNADPNELGPNEAGEKAPPSDWLAAADIVMGAKADIAPMGDENDIPGKAPKLEGAKLSLRRIHCMS